MGQGISEVLPFAIGIAISPIPIIAIVLILFSNRATVNGLSFLFGWVLGLAVVGTAVYLFADAANAATDSTTSDSISWGKIVLGVAAARPWPAATSPSDRRRVKPRRCPSGWRRSRPSLR